MNPEIKSIPAQLVASLSQRVVIAEIGPFTRRALDTLAESITQAHIEMVGAPIATYYERMTDTEPGLMEIAWPINRRFEAIGIDVKELPAMQVVSITVSQDQADAGEIPVCYGMAFAWMAQQGYRVAGSNRDCYLAQRDASRGDQPYIEIQIPIE